VQTLELSLVFGFSSRSIGKADGLGKVGGTGKGVFPVVDADVPKLVGPMIDVFLVVGVDELVFSFNLADSDLVEFHLNFGLREVKPG
jgi:hypothetical protein